MVQSIQYLGKWLIQFYGLGHCLSYNLTMDIKTGVAEQILQKMSDTEIIPLQPLTEKSVVPTSFWVDNFDININSLFGRLDSSLLFIIQNNTNLKLRRHHRIDEEYFLSSRFPYGFFSVTSTPFPLPSIAISRVTCVIKRWWWWRCQ